MDGNFWLGGSGAGAVGHGRVELLEHILQTGSISRAARAMGMSYKAAWDAVEAMNNLADVPLVERSAGGRHGGGTRLTSQGRRLVEIYRAAELEFRQFLDRLGSGIADFERFYSLMRRLGVKTSARNQLGGRVTTIRSGAVNSEVALDLGGDELVAVVTNESVEALGLRRGSLAHALIKASWVILASADGGQRVSARNRLCGVVAEIRRGPVDAEVTLELAGGKRLTAVVTSASVAALGLEPGARVCALIKASHVILAVDA